MKFAFVALTVLAAVSSILAAATPDVRIIKPEFPSPERRDCVANIAFHLALREDIRIQR